MVVWIRKNGFMGVRSKDLTLLAVSKQVGFYTIRVRSKDLTPIVKNVML